MRGTSIAVLAGGLATRMGDLTARTPKVLLELAGRPFLAWQLDLFHAQGLTDVVLCVGHLGEYVEAAAAVLAPPGMRVRLSFDGAERLGTGGALRKALPLLSDPFLVIYGDSYLRGDYGAAVARFEAARRAVPSAAALMTVYRNASQFDASNVDYCDGRILRYDKRDPGPNAQYIDWGLGVLTHAAFDAITDRPVFDLAELYQALLRHGRLAGHEVHERFYEIGSHSGLRELRTLLGGAST